MGNYDAIAAAGISYVAGPSGFGQAVVLSGAGSYIDLPNPGPLDFLPTDAWTAEIRFNTAIPNAATGLMVALGKSDVVAGSARWYLGLLMQAGGGFPAFAVGPVSYTHNVAGNDGAWHTLAVTVAPVGGGQVKAYYLYDGILVSTSANFTWAPSVADRNYAEIGCWSQHSLPWNGKLQEAAISLAALYTSSYTPATAPFANNRAGQIALWHLNGNTTDSAVVIPAKPTLVGSLSPDNTTLILAGNTPVPGAAPIAATELYTGGNGGNVLGWPTGAMTVPAVASQSGTDAKTFNQPATGTRAWWRLRELDTAGLRSPWSNEIDLIQTKAISPDDGSILYSPCNWYVTHGFAATINPGSYWRTYFTGRTLALTYDVSRAPSPAPTLAYRLDGGDLVQFSPASLVTISAGGLGNRRHLLEVFSRTIYQGVPRWVPINGIPQSSAILTSIIVDADAVMTLPPRRLYTIIAFGDSITEGIGTLVSVLDGVADSLSNSALAAYAYQLYEMLPAEVAVIGFGGTGLTVSGSGGVPPLTQTYNYLWQGRPRDFTNPPPTIVAYLHGTNDAGSTDAAVTSALTQVLGGIASAAPQAQQVVFSPFNQSKAAALSSAVLQMGSPLIRYISTTGVVSIPQDTSDNTHYWAATHRGKMAPYIASVLAPLLVPSAPSDTFSRLGHRGS